MSDAEYQLRNDQFISLGTSFLHSVVSKGIHIYLPIKRNKEPDTFPVLKFLSDQQIPVVVSKTDFQRKEMIHFRYDKKIIFEENHLRIPEPVSGEVTSLEMVDVVLVPLVAADKKGNRVGYGGGYYDRLLQDTDQQVTKVGASLSYPFDLFPFTETHDVPLDYCITPFKVLNFNG